ncbi:hypothetical protein LSH36_224g02021 [Paralvinella palmiformis]|uniref:Peptidoglycan recognition protein family domain-containing protein n=1 Tax=Paralvinella palmiformis TaxID=53620 RepID=A0AAD9JMK6_9ANNE|nr:hypothetical protein LSH36_224g02021 [Paralvinella palmiformis]
MRVLNILLFLALGMAHLVQQGDAWGSFRWRRIITDRTRCCFGGCYSKEQMSDLCEGVEKSMIKREEWEAAEPRQVLQVNGIADNIILLHTGPDTCTIGGLSRYNCERCMQDEECMKGFLIAFQANDLDDGKDDIRYNFLIGQDGVIYEGRGWGVVGQHTKGNNLLSVGIGMIGDFTKSEPSQASQNALKNLLSCGQAAEALSRSADFTTGPKMTGKALFEMIKRCNGLCTGQK